MQLTDRQLEIVMAIREIAKVPESECWGAFIDFTGAIATMVEGAESLIHPSLMQQRFAAAWEAYANVWTTEHNRILRDCVRNKEQLEHVKTRPYLVRQIIERVQEVHGELTPGMSVDDVDVTDILESLNNRGDPFDSLS